MNSKITNRDVTVDILRGLAIFSMVAANMASLSLYESNPFWLRYYGSFAAPLFIFISGMMVAVTTKTRGHVLKFFLLRGGMIIVVGAIMDMCVWKILPFMTVDVLYLIGLSLPLAHLFLRMNSFFRWITVICIFATTPLLQNILGYADYPTEFHLWGRETVAIINQADILNHWIIDGWFPLFPWLGFSLLGVIFGEQRWKGESGIPSCWFGRKKSFLFGIIVLAIGSCVWWLLPGKLLTRGGYSELFYPPTIGYIISAVGLISLLLSIVGERPSGVYSPVKALGESALLIYIFHSVLIEYVISSAWPKRELQTFLIIYILFLFFLILVAYGLRPLKIKWYGAPLFIRFLLGGRGRDWVWGGKDYSLRVGTKDSVWVTRRGGNLG